MPQVYRYHSETDPDMDIIDADNNTYKCHKAVLRQTKGLSIYFDHSSSGRKNSKAGFFQLVWRPPSHLKGVLDYLYTKNYSSPCGEGEESLLFHFSMYIMGRDYALSGLKELAKIRIWMAGNSITKSHILASAIEAVYKNASPNDKGLKDVVVVVAKRQIEMHMENRTFREMMDGLGEFGKDLVASIVSRAPYTFWVKGSQLVYVPIAEGGLV